MKTVNDLIQELSALPKKVRKKPVVVFAVNGLEIQAEVRFIRKDGQFSKIESVVITYS